MPELPEVQTIVNDLQGKIIGEKIIHFCSDFFKSIKTPNFEKNIINKKILAVYRIGKNIAIELSGKQTILVHLKMTGKLIFRKDTLNKNSRLSEKHVHSVFFFEKNKRIEFSDIRKFGTLSLLDKSEVNEKIANNGIDPFSENFNLSNISNLLANKNMKIKAALMNQALISGIGNIYASEILFDAKILPQKITSTLTKREISRIISSTLKILRKSILLRGTSVSDYRDSENKKGQFQNYLKVYKKDGQKCKKCDTIIEKIIINQRSTFFCGKCQK